MGRWSDREGSSPPGYGSSCFQGLLTINQVQTTDVACYETAIFERR
jgi:hypothetical protein